MAAAALAPARGRLFPTGRFVRAVLSDMDGFRFVAAQGTALLIRSSSPPAARTAGAEAEATP